MLNAAVLTANPWVLLTNRTCLAVHSQAHTLKLCPCLSGLWHSPLTLQSLTQMFFMDVLWFLIILYFPVSLNDNLHLHLLTLSCSSSYTQCQALASVYLFFPLSPFPLSCPYQRPCLLIQHASMVTFSHECPRNPPHLVFKSMQITTSKSSGASSETELCTCGGLDEGGRGCGVRWGRACSPLYSSLILSYVYVMLLIKRSPLFF